MIYVIKTPNPLYNGVTEGVQFENGIGKTDHLNIRNILVNDYGYEDVTEYENQDKQENVNDGTDNDDQQENLNDSSEKENPEENSLDLEELTVDQLKEIAKNSGLSNYSKLKRDELIELINNSKNA